MTYSSSLGKEYSINNDVRSNSGAIRGAGIDGMLWAALAIDEFDNSDNFDTNEDSDSSEVLTLLIVVVAVNTAINF